MTDKKSTFGLRTDQLASIFSIGLNDDDLDGKQKGSRDETIESALYSQLNSELPKGSMLFDSLLMLMGRLGCEVQSLGGKSLCHVLLDPRTDAGLLEAIKDYSKKQSSISVSEVEAAIATTTYYAALASALLYHNKKITQYSYETLDKSFAMLAEKKWMTPELIGLFSRARELCRKGQEDKNEKS